MSYAFNVAHRNLFSLKLFERLQYLLIRHIIRAEEISAVKEQHKSLDICRKHSD